MDFSFDFTLPKTKSNYKGEIPPIYTPIDSNIREKLAALIDNPVFPGRELVSKTGLLYTITNNMMIGKRWNKKEFSVDEKGILKYASHDKFKGNKDLFMCTVHETDGSSFKLPIPADSYPFVIQSLQPEDPWEFELCAETNDSREEWIEYLWKCIIDRKKHHFIENS